MLTLTHSGFLGVDGGAYAHGVNVLFGGSELGVGFPRPPLAPGYLLWPFIEFLGLDNGYKVWSAIASLAPAVPVYLFARRIQQGARVSSTTPALFAAGFILLDLLHGEMIVTGALPLIGFGLLGLTWWGLCSLHERWTWQAAATVVITLGLIPYVNQTTAGLAIVTIPIFMAGLLWFGRHDRLHSPWQQAQRLLPALIAGGAIALGALPWYTQVLPVSGVLNYPGPFIYLTHIYDSAWFQLLLAWPLGIWMIRKGEQPWLQSLGVLTILLGTLTVFMSTDETVLNIFYRSRYLLAIPVFIGFAWLVFVRWLPAIHWRWAAPAGIAVALVFMSVGYVSQFDRQAGYSKMITQDTTAALELIPDNGKAVINNSFTMALWVAGLKKTGAPHTWTWQPPPTWTETDQHVRCVLGWVPECSPSESIAQLNAGWVLIEGRFPFYNERAPGVYGATNEREPWANLPDVPWLSLVFEQGTTQLYQITTAATALPSAYTTDNILP